MKMPKLSNKFVKCIDCTKSKMNGIELICTEFQEVILNDGYVFCSEFDFKTADKNLNKKEKPHENNR